MSCFKRTSDNCVISSITLVQGNKLILKLDGEGKSLVTHYKIDNPKPKFLEITSRADSKRREQTITLEAQRIISSPFHIQARDPKTNELSNKVPSFEIRSIVPKISLPGEETDVGLIVCLLLAETRSPLIEGYGDGKEAFKSMDMMKEVLDNRLYASSQKGNLGLYINSVPQGSGIRAIIFAPGQVQDFKGGVIGGKARENIDQFIAIMNDGTSTEFKKVRPHVEYALKVAQRPAVLAPLTPKSLTHWRTAKSSSPTPNAVPFRTVAGQTFYTLTEKYLKDNTK